MRWMQNIFTRAPLKIVRPCAKSFHCRRIDRSSGLLEDMIRGRDILHFSMPRIDCSSHKAGRHARHYFLSLEERSRGASFLKCENIVMQSLRGQKNLLSVVLWS